MVDRAFNYATRAFRRHTAHSGFWSYVQPVPEQPGHFLVRPDKDALRRMPGHVFRSIGVAGCRPVVRASDVAA